LQKSDTLQKRDQKQDKTRGIIQLLFLSESCRNTFRCTVQWKAKLIDAGQADILPHLVAVTCLYSLMKANDCTLPKSGPKIRYVFVHQQRSVLYCNKS